MQDSDDEDLETVRYEVDPSSGGGRLDAVLAALHPVLSRSRLKELIEGGAVAVDGRTIREGKFRVKPGEAITLVAPPPEDPEPRPEAIPLSILYEDAELIVLDKPAGMVVHPAPGSWTGTLVNALIFHCGPSLVGIGGVRRPGIVHRLDRDTSGVMVAAKTERALRGLAEQFADHGRTGPLHRAYRAFAWGHTQTARGTVDAPLGRDSNNRLKQQVRSDGREAITHYQVIARFGEDSWDITELHCELETGRTHQIRVHMTHLGHPLVSDPVYASGFATKVNRLPPEPSAAVLALGRQALHAAELGFEHPTTGEEMGFEAPLPADLQALADALEPFNKAFRVGG